MRTDLAEVIVMRELASRGVHTPDYLKEKLAILDLAARMADEPEAVLPRFVESAMALTGGVSAGLSLYEGTPSGGAFRWRYLHGQFAAFEHATAQFDCNLSRLTLEGGRSLLAKHPERHYEWIAAACIEMPEVLLVPLHMRGDEPVGTLWIVAPTEEYFDCEHVRVASELATFAGIALKMLRTELRLQAALEMQETLATEMSHRVKNLLAVSVGMINVSARAADSKEELAESLTSRFHALANAHSLVRRSFGAGHGQQHAFDLGELLRTVVKAYERPAGQPQRFTITGPPVSCGEFALNGFALVFHELLTNAAKYGALATEAGQVEITWMGHEESLLLAWKESGGPRIETPPARSGFGSRLLHTTVERQFGGSVEQRWNVHGLVIDITIPMNAVQG